jgi:hypothetical protein
MATYHNICSPDMHDTLPIQIECCDCGSTNSGETHDPQAIN